MPVPFDFLNTGKTSELREVSALSPVSKGSQLSSVSDTYRRSNTRVAHFFAPFRSMKSSLQKWIAIGM